MGKDKRFMIEYNQTSSEIHINEILHVLIMPHVLMGHVCSSQYYGFDYISYKKPSSLRPHTNVLCRMTLHHSHVRLVISLTDNSS